MFYLGGTSSRICGGYLSAYGFWPAELISIRWAVVDWGAHLSLEFIELSRLSHLRRCRSELRLRHSTILVGEASRYSNNDSYHARIMRESIGLYQLNAFLSMVDDDPKCLKTLENW